MPRDRNQTRPATLLAKERAAQAVKLRIGGASFPQIAAQLGYNSTQSAFDAVKRTLQQTLREPADELRSVDSERLDALWHQAFSKALDGDLPAQQACLKILDRRAKLLGLDMPQKNTYTDADGKGPLEVIVRLENVASIKPND